MNLLLQGSIDLLRRSSHVTLLSLAMFAATAAEPSRPLSPSGALATFRLADDRLRIKLVAAEPDVVSSVAIAFDADGRLFVAEMIDYPNAQTSGRIRLLEDRDGDGRYETATVFADQLPFPNGVLPWRDGGQVGPDLSGFASRPKDAMPTDILDPSRQVSPDFINYTLTTRDGQQLTGFIASETGGSVTLRRANEPDDTMMRSQIKELRAEGKSLMPEGLEQGLAAQDMADLLSFLQKPESSLLPGVP